MGRRLVVFGLLAGLLGSASHAADPQPYDVTLTPTGEAAIDQGVAEASALVSLRSTAAVGPFALLARARADVQRFQSVLDSEGRYGGSVSVSIAGHPLDDADLPAALEATPSGRAVPVVVGLTPGPLYHLGRIDLTGDVPPAARAAFGLRPGAPARAADVLAAREQLLAALRAAGHAFAKVASPVAVLRPEALALDVSIAVEAGPSVTLGPIGISGLGRTNEAFIRRRLLLHPGETFNPDAIEKARQDLAGIGVFGSVRIDPATKLDAAGRLPLQITVVERPRHTVNLGASWSTDVGGNATATWTHHNLFGNAEQLTLSAGVEDLGGTAALAPGYKLSADLLLPDWGRRDQTLDLAALAVDETLEAYSRRAVQGGATLARKLTPELTASLGVQMEEAYIVQEGVGRDYTLPQLPGELRYDTTHAALDPARGVRAKLSIVPSLDLGAGGAAFVIAQASASVYLDVGALLFATTGRSVVAARALVGGVEGASTFDIPPDQRFYAGGGGSVRGFRFQSLGPQFADSKPIGGTAVDTASIELRQRIGANYGVAAFVDAGQVGSGGVPFAGAVHVGAGVGVRYYTGFGPLRLDVALPVTREPGGDAFELYLGLGQAF
jgi:translocation and assembly module TamA